MTDCLCDSKFEILCTFDFYILSIHSNPYYYTKMDYYEIEKSQCLKKLTFDKTKHRQ